MGTQNFYLNNLIKFKKKNLVQENMSDGQVSCTSRLVQVSWLCVTTIRYAFSYPISWGDWRPHAQWLTSLFDLTFAEPIRGSAKVRSKHLYLDQSSTKLPQVVPFWLKYVLRPNFSCANWLKPSQEVKSPSLWHAVVPWKVTRSTSWPWVSNDQAHCPLIDAGPIYSWQHTRRLHQSTGFLFLKSYPP